MSKHQNYGISDHEANLSLSNGCRTWSHCQSFTYNGEKQRINIQSRPV